MKKISLLLVMIVWTLTSFSQAKKKLVGYWYKPKTMTNIRFYPNNTFEYSAYDSLSNKSEKLTGKYKLKRTNLTLEFVNNTKQTLNFDKAKTAGTKNYYLRENDNYFIKDERVNDAVPPDSTQKSGQ
jgi:hypothetical protein